MNKQFKNGLAAAIIEVLRYLWQNQQVLAEAVGVVLPYVPNWDVWDNINKVCQGEGGCTWLPMKMARRIKDKAVWERAIQQGYILMGDDGCLRWELGTKTLLAYFLGRLLCGDKPKWSKRYQHYVWEQGDDEFPNAEAERLFGVKNLKVLRKKAEKCNVPDGADAVDCLWVTNE